METITTNTSRKTRAERRDQVRVLYYRHRLTMDEISRNLGVSKPTVCRDVKWLRRQAMETARAETEQMVAEMNREFEELKDETWRAYKRSLEAKEGESAPQSSESGPQTDNRGSASPESSSAKHVPKRVSNAQDGAPRYFSVIARVLEKQAKLFRLGGFGPQSKVAAQEPEDEGGANVVLYLPHNGRDSLPANAIDEDDLPWRNLDETNMKQI